MLGARRLDRLQALAKDLKLKDGSVLKTDVTDRTQVKRLVDGAVEDAMAASTSSSTMPG